MEHDPARITTADNSESDNLFINILLIENKRFPCFETDLLNLVPISDGILASVIRDNCGGLENSTLPGDVHCETTSRSKTFHLAVRPFGRNGRKQVNLTGMRLEKHLGYAGRPTEIAVNLERRMSVEEVILRGLGKESIHIRSSLFTVPEAGVEIDKPSPAPASVGTLAGDRIFIVLTPAFNCPFRRGEELGVFVRNDRARIKAEKMGLVRSPHDPQSIPGWCCNARRS